MKEMFEEYGQTIAIILIGLCLVRVLLAILQALSF